MANNILLLITSPFQYWCIQEYLFKHNLSDRQITVVNGASFCGNSMRQIERLHRNLSSVNEIKLTIPANSKLEARIEPYANVARELKRIKFERVLVGDLREIWMQDIACFVDSESVILVDDGAATNVFTEKLIAPNDFFIPIALHTQSQSRRLEAIEIKKRLGLSIANKSITLFSIFPFEQYRNTEQNKLSLLQEVFAKTQIEQLTETHFIGSPVCEKGIIDQATYLNIISQAKREFDSSAKLIYFAHRAENLDVKRASLESLGFEIERHDEPYELVCAEHGRSPYAVVGLHSTSLFNMKILLGQRTRAICYKLPSDILLRLESKSMGSDRFSLREHIESIYRRLNEFGIESRTAE